MDFTPHSDKQERLIFSEKRIRAGFSGIQWGKTISGALSLAQLTHEFIDPGDAFIITAPNYKTMMQSTLPPFKQIMDGRYHYNKKDEVFEIYGGGSIYLRTGTDPDSIVGITNVRGIWCDEAGLYSLYFWENIQGRASFKEAPIILTSSPYALNWCYKEIILPITRDPHCRPDVELVQARSDENPYFPKAEYESKKKTMDPRRFNMMYGGGWEKMQGLVYDCFSSEENVCSPSSLPAGTKFIAGVDWGYTHPFVIIVRGITPSGNHYQVAEFYKTNMSLEKMKEAAAQKKSTWGIEKFICGPDRPENIAAFCSAGLPAVAADNIVQKGIDAHYTLIETRRYKIFEGTSPHTMDEYEKYHWPSPEELEPDQDSKQRNPVKQDDDCMDANRYISIAYPHENAAKRPPKTPEQKKQMEIQEQMEALKKKRRPSERTENWS